MSKVLVTHLGGVHMLTAPHMHGKDGSGVGEVEDASPHCASAMHRYRAICSC